jgi:hypothetical protein
MTPHLNNRPDALVQRAALVAAAAIGASLADPSCHAQQVIEGIKGAKLVQWDIVGLISSMAVPSEGPAIFGGWRWVDLGNGQVTSKAMLWSVDDVGNVAPQELSSLSSSFANAPKVVNAIARNGEWIGGATSSSAIAAAGTLWNAQDLSNPQAVGVSVVGPTGQPQPAQSSSVVAVSDDGTSFGTSVDMASSQWGVIQPLNGDAEVLPALPPAPGLVSNMFPLSVSSDGNIVVGQSYFFFGGSYPRATLWRREQNTPELLFTDDLTSTASTISPNGVYAGGYVTRFVGGNVVSRGFVADLESDQFTYLDDESGAPWNSPVIDVADDGRVAVGDFDALSGYNSYSPNSGFVAIDGVARPMADWLDEEFGLGSLSIDLVQAVYLDGDRYHFAAQSRRSGGNGTVYYITIPTASLFPSTAGGDYDQDGDVDGDDFLAWQRDDGAAAGLADWKANFGRVTSNESLAHVPEPGSKSLLAVAIGCCMAASTSRRAKIATRA